MSSLANNSMLNITSETLDSYLAECPAELDVDMLEMMGLVVDEIPEEITSSNELFSLLADLVSCAEVEIDLTGEKPANVMMTYVGGAPGCDEVADFIGEHMNEINEDAVGSAFCACGMGGEVFISGIVFEQGNVTSFNIPKSKVGKWEDNYEEGGDPDAYTPEAIQRICKEIGIVSEYIV